MDDQRKEKSTALPQELWNETAARAEGAGCGINDIIERALRAYFDLVGEPQAGQPARLSSIHSG
jgi:hypothetical protein